MSSSIRVHFVFFSSSVNYVLWLADNNVVSKRTEFESLYLLRCKMALCATFYE